MQGADRKWLRVAFWVTFALLFVAFGVAPGILRHRLKNDLVGAVTQSAVAPVALLVVPPGNDASGQHEPPYVAVRFQGSILSAKDALDVAQLKVGQAAQITYRVGKSGKIYVDTVRPLLPDSPAADID